MREWGSAILAAVALAASLLTWVSDRSVGVRERLAAVEARLASVQEQLNRIETRLNK